MPSIDTSPIWSHGSFVQHQPLQGDRAANVVVVGAGIAGLTTALLLAKAGLDVAVLEARRVGGGTTGRTTAKVSALQGTRYQTLAEQHGQKMARNYAAAQLAGLAWMEEMVTDLDADVRWERRPAFTYATDTESRRQIEAEAAAATLAGLDAQLTDSTELPFATEGAVVLADQAQFDPQAYLDGLAAQVESFGGVIYEETRVTAIRGLRSHSVVTDRGTIRTPYVVVATLLPILDRGLFFARAEPKASYTIAVELPGRVLAGMYLSAGSPSRSLRSAWHNDHEVLVVGGAGHTVGRQRPTTTQYEQLERWARDQFHAKAVISRWSAHDLVPDDHLPWAGPSSPATPNVLVAGGFAKWGMTNATAAALVLADRITGNDDGPSSVWRSAFDTARFPPKRLRETARINAGVAVNMVSGWVRPGHGTGEEDGAHRRGVVPTGTAQTTGGLRERRSLVCTHLGGICGWNDAERTWDCPLHGSRFEADGTVVAAPATSPLHPVDSPAGPPSAVDVKAGHRLAK